MKNVLTLSNLELILKIFAMAGITYLVRMLPLALFRKKITNPYILSFLYYVPYAVLSAMTFPAILYATGNIYSGIAGLVCGLITAFLTSNMVIVAGCTSIGALVVQWICSIL